MKVHARYDPPRDSWEVTAYTHTPHGVIPYVIDHYGDKPARIVSDVEVADGVQVPPTLLLPDEGVRALVDAVRGEHPADALRDARDDARRVRNQLLDAVLRREERLWPSAS